MSLNLGGIIADMQRRHKWASKKFPRPVVFKMAGGLSVTKLGHVQAFRVKDKLQWGRTWEPRLMTPDDELEYDAIQAKYRALNRKLEKFKLKAYDRGEALSLEAAARITDAVEGTKKSSTKEEPNAQQ